MLGLVSSTDTAQFPTLQVDNVKSCSRLGTDGSGNVVCMVSGETGEILLESGDKILLESGDNIDIEG